MHPIEEMIIALLHLLISHGNGEVSISQIEDHLMNSLTEELTDRIEMMKFCNLSPGECRNPLEQPTLDEFELSRAERFWGSDRLPGCKNKPCQKSRNVIRVYVSDTNMLFDPILRLYFQRVRKMLGGWTPYKIGNETIIGEVIDFGDCKGTCSGRSVLLRCNISNVISSTFY